ncbi:hypothetical protein K0B96_13775 [Horticoccus luteus]|uniref:RadC-like JAB domain-containing protein n=1 Tax=Horticoccus luteus TaxID=2862869 RepID=A0A8F9XN60_9BACT|nr:hypothetical protein K0B96_13775 [Horticoccus luteus]
MLVRTVITLDTLDSTLAIPREVFRGAISAGASALVAAVNAPEPEGAGADCTSFCAKWLPGLGSNQRPSD